MGVTSVKFKRANCCLDCEFTAYGHTLMHYDDNVRNRSVIVRIVRYSRASTAMSTVSSTASLMLDLPPSCIAFCPSRPQLFVVGTYFLHPRDPQSQKTSSFGDSTDADQTEEDITSVPDDKSQANQEQKRTGSLILFRLDRDDKMYVRQVFWKKTSLTNRSL